MSAPAWDVEHEQVWYSDSNSGFYAVRLTNGIASALRQRAAPAPAALPRAAAPRPAAAPAEGSTLPTTGSPAALGVLAVVLIGIAGTAARRLRR